MNSDNNNQPGNQSQHPRQDVEVMRLQYEQHRIFLQRWEATLHPSLEAAERSRDMAHGYTKIGVQMMFLLNGGAIIAFPTFANMAGIRFADHPRLAVCSILAFVLGLALIAVTTIYAFLAMDADSRAIRESTNAKLASLNKELEPQNATWDQSRDKAEKQEAKDRKSANCRRTIAICLSIASWLAFVGGASIGAYILSTAHP